MRERAKCFEVGYIQVSRDAVELGEKLRVADLHRVKMHHQARCLAVRITEAKVWVSGVFQWHVHLIFSEVHEVENVGKGGSRFFYCPHPQVLVFEVFEDGLHIPSIPLHQAFQYLVN